MAAILLGFGMFIQNPNHSAFERIWTVRNPHALGFRAPTVVWYWNPHSKRNAAFLQATDGVAFDARFVKLVSAQTVDNAHTARTWSSTEVQEE